jgi:hypothetical protein
MEKRGKIRPNTAKVMFLRHIELLKVSIFYNLANITFLQHLEYARMLHVFDVALFTHGIDAHMYKSCTQYPTDIPVGCHISIRFC